MQAGSKWFYRPGDGSDGPAKMLLVHQTPTQARMLSKYGDTVGMDSTYKTNVWGFPLVLWVIVDNHRHGYPVGMALVQSEEGGVLAQALGV